MFRCICNNFLYIGHNILLNYYIFLFSLFPNYFRDAIINAKKRNDTLYNNMMFINFSTDIYNTYNIDLFSIIYSFNNTCKNNITYTHLNSNNDSNNDSNDDSNDDSNNDSNDDSNNDSNNDSNDDSNNDSVSVMSDCSDISKISN